MSVEATLYTRLTTHAGLSALIAARVHPNKLPQGVTLPAVSYRRVSAERVPAMGSDTGLVRARFQFDAWAAGYQAMLDVKEQLRAALERWSTTTGTVIQDIFYRNETDMFESANEREAEVHHGALDFEIIYEE